MRVRRKNKRRWLQTTIYFKLYLQCKHITYFIYRYIFIFFHKPVVLKRYVRNRWFVFINCITFTRDTLLVYCTYTMESLKCYDILSDIWIMFTVITGPKMIRIFNTTKCIIRHPHQLRSLRQYSVTDFQIDSLLNSINIVERKKVVEYLPSQYLNLVVNINYCHTRRYHGHLFWSSEARTGWLPKTLPVITYKFDVLYRGWHSSERLISSARIV